MHAKLIIRLAGCKRPSVRARLGPSALCGLAFRRIAQDPNPAKVGGREAVTNARNSSSSTSGSNAPLRS